MSRENVEIVRAAFEAWNAGDMDAVREWHDPEEFVRPAGRLPEGMLGALIGGASIPAARGRRPVD
jgi:ketosteroid isomerase-like protein